MGKPRSAQGEVRTGANGIGRSRLLPVPLRSVKALLVVGCVLIIVGVSSFVGWSLYCSSQHWRLAAQAAEQMDWDAAERHLKSYLLLWPSSAEGHFFLARTLRRSGDVDAAATELDEARRFGCAAELVELERRLMQVQAGALGPHHKALEKYLTEPSEHDRCVWEAIIVGGLMGNNLGVAYESCDRWAERYPDDWQPAYWRGRVLEAGLQHRESADQYLRVLRDHPDFSPARLRVAEVLLFLGLYPEALPHFERYVERHPESVEGLVGLARCRHSTGRPKEALEIVKTALRHDPANAQALLLRGRLELEAGSAESALAWFRKAEARLPADQMLCLAMASALRRLDRDDEAREYEAKRERIHRDLRRIGDLVKEIVANRPNDVELRYEVGRTLIDLGHYDHGLRWITSGLLINPRHEPSRQKLLETVPKLGDKKLTAAFLKLAQPK